MRIILFTALLYGCCYSCLAQNTSDVGKISLSVVMPDNVDGLDATQLSKLETKITQIVSTSGLAASGYNNNFVIYPKFSVYETSVVEGGMQNITVSTCELSLFVKQVDNNILFSSTSKQLKGSGSNKILAITNAISKIAPSESQYKTFIEGAKTKIIEYYEAKCTDILLKSESFVKTQKYEDALGLLLTVPEEVSCYNKVQERSIEVYKAYQSYTCAKQIQAAKTALAAHENNRALTLLSEIDPSATCFKEAESMMRTAETKINAEEKKQWDMKVKMYNDNVALEKQRITAVKDIASAYYKSKPTTVNYSYIVR